MPKEELNRNLAWRLVEKAETIRVYGACRIDNSEVRRSGGLEHPYSSSDVLIVLNKKLADATKMRNPGSGVSDFVIGDSVKARLYVLNITDNSRHEEV